MRSKELVCQHPDILIVDDEKMVCELLNEELSDRGFICTTALDAHTALSRLAAHHFDVALLDIKLPGISGIDLLRTIRSDYCDTTAIMITAVNDADTAVQAIKLGAWDYVVKPFSLDRVEASIRTALETEQRSVPAGSIGLASDAIQRKHATDEFPEIDVIARGVEARYENSVGMTRIITAETAEIAINLGIPEERVNRWVKMRTRVYAERKRIIELMLARLEKNPLAQAFLGMTDLPPAQMPDQN